MDSSILICIVIHWYSTVSSFIIFVHILFIKDPLCEKRRHEQGISFTHNVQNEETAPRSPFWMYEASPVKGRSTINSHQQSITEQQSNIFLSITQAGQENLKSAISVHCKKQKDHRIEVQQTQTSDQGGNRDQEAGRGHHELGGGRVHALSTWHSSDSVGRGQEGRFDRSVGLCLQFQLIKT